MANWVEGVFRVRGKKEDMIKFIRNELATGYDAPPHIIGDKYDDGNIYFAFTSDDSYEKKIWFKHLKRCYLEYGDEHKLIKSWVKDNEYMIVENFKSAWDISLEEIIKLVKNNYVDIKVNGYESGMRFSKLYEVDRNGRVLLSEERMSYNDYNWDCIMPLLGG